MKVGNEGEINLNTFGTINRCSHKTNLENIYKNVLV